MAEPLRINLNPCATVIMSGNDEQVVTRHLSLSYGRGQKRLVVLDDVSLTVHRGEIVVLAGDNGVGKSSVLKVLAGTVPPDRGEVIIFGQSPSQAKIGVVWQDTYTSLYPWLTSLENAALPLRLKGVRRRERQRRVLQLAEELAFDLPLDRRPFELSGGEQQKVCILRALASDCELLLLDEPFSNLSFDSSIDLLTHVQEIHAKTNLTTIVVSHLPEFSIFVADAVIPLDGKPVRLDDSDRVDIRCPYPKPRPRGWMFEESFRTQVDRIKNGTRSEC